MNTVIFQLQIDDPGQDEPDIGHSILFERQERGEQEPRKLLQRQRSVGQQLIADVDVALAQHPAAARTELGRQVDQQRTEEDRRRSLCPVIVRHLFHDLTDQREGRQAHGRHPVGRQRQGQRQQELRRILQKKISSIPLFSALFFI